MQGRHTSRSAVWSASGANFRTAFDARTLLQDGYGLSQRHCKQIEEVFGWIRAQSCFANAKVRGLAKVDTAFTMMAAAYNL